MSEGAGKMYKIKEENGQHVVYCKDKEVAKFKSKKEAIEYLEEKTKYPEKDSIDDSIIIDEN